MSIIFGLDVPSKIFSVEINMHGNWKVCFFSFPLSSPFLWCDWGDSKLHIINFMLFSFLVTEMITYQYIAECEDTTINQQKTYLWLTCTTVFFLLVQICYFFYKNITFGFTLFWFEALASFSGQPAYNDWYMSFYNVFFTSLPVIALGVFDQDVSARFCLEV